MGIRKKLCFSVVFSVLIILSSGISQTQQRGPASITLCLAKYEILRSRLLSEDRKILVHVPDDYEQSAKRYPVLYVLDAEDTERYIRIVEAISFFSAVRRLPKMIVVGILNTDRRRDISPQKIEQFENSGGGALFMRFITTELLPYVDDEYRTAPFRILYGASSAGMFTIYTLFNSSESFHAFIASRPALNSTPDYTWDSDIIFRDAIQLFSNKSSLNKYLYIDHGGQEDTLHDPALIYKLAGLFNSNAPDDFHWKIHKMSESGYRSAESLKDGLLNVFSSWYFSSDSLITLGIEGIQSHAKELSRIFNYSIGIEDLLDEDVFNQISNHILKK